SLPALPRGVGLVEAVAALRRGHAMPPGEKLLIVIDQFEQWLHSDPDDHAALIPALRHCDGVRVQCLVLVRDDFGMATTRFLNRLEDRLREGQNFATVDLFDPRHARRVLTEFGRAYGCLPPPAQDLGVEAERFLDEALAGLREGGKIVPVRLS